MSYETIPDAIEAGNYIIGFKTEEEKKQAEEIEEAIETTEPIDAASHAINILLSFRTDISRIKESKNEIIKNALTIVREKLNAQIAAIFLFSKDGQLERVGIEGIDRNDKTIENEWYQEESYQVGESFIGRSAQVKIGSKYGEIQYIQSFKEEDLTETSRHKYVEKIGEIKSAIAVPLNGRNKTYGVIQVINKIQFAAKDLIISDNKFSESDVIGLSFLSKDIANALSNFRRDVQTGILEHLSHLLIRTFNYHGSNEICFTNVCQQIIDLLVKNPETAFKAGIIRLKTQVDLLEVKATSFSEGVTEKREDRAIKINSGLAGRVAQSGETIILQGIQKKQQISKFNNRVWIEQNRFESFGCFPLLAKDNEVLGTLSLYTGYNYDFYPDSIKFVQSVADLLASFVYRLKLEEMKYEIEREATGVELRSIGVNTSLRTQTTRSSDTAVKATITRRNTDRYQGTKANITKQNASDFEEKDLLTILENQTLSIQEIASIFRLSIDDVSRVVKPLFINGFIDTVGNNIFDYIFPKLGKNRRAKPESLTPDVLLLITSKGYYRLHPFIV